MAKSDEIKIIKSATLPDNLDYSRLPKAVLEAITLTQYDIDKKVKLSWDGRQFVVRIPKEIAVEMGVSEEDYIRFSITKKFADTEKPELRIELVHNGDTKV